MGAGRPCELCEQIRARFAASQLCLSGSDRGRVWLSTHSEVGVQYEYGMVHMSIQCAFRRIIALLLMHATKKKGLGISQDLWV